jgi:hypothetical protein
MSLVGFAGKMPSLGVRQLNDQWQFLEDGNDHNSTQR